jgi:hypothetical protein
LDKTYNGKTRDTSSIETRHRMDKPETQAALRQYKENGQIRDRGSIETRHIMDKPETQAVLRQDTEWANQRYR